MTPLFAKLNLGEHREIVVLDAPASFEPELAALDGVAVRRTEDRGPIALVLAFVSSEAQIERTASWLPRAEGDAVVWFAYPKKTSKTYTTDIHRDRGWDTLAAQGFAPVRQVAIDDDWSALRFRRRAFVKGGARR